MVMAGKKNPFKGRQFTAEIILWAVRWYLQFPISYPISSACSQIVAFRSITRPCSAGSRPMLHNSTSGLPHLRPTNGSWRVDGEHKELWGNNVIRSLGSHCSAADGLDHSLPVGTLSQDALQILMLS
jgi:hypothetical protein